MHIVHSQTVYLGTSTYGLTCTDPLVLKCIRLIQIFFQMFQTCNLYIKGILLVDLFVFCEFDHLIDGL